MARQIDGAISRIDAFGHTHLRLTDEHPVLTRRGYVPAQYLCSEDWIALPRWRPAIGLKRIYFSDYFTHEDLRLVRTPIPEHIDLSPSFGRLIGLFLAEGSVNQNSVRWTFDIAETDTLVAETVSIINSLGAKASIAPRSNNAVNVVLCGKQWRLLFELLCSKGCAGKRMHPDLWQGDDIFLTAVMTAWLDGDGHCRQGATKTSGTTVSSDLAQDMFGLAQWLGFDPSINGRQPKEENKQFRWDVSIRNQVAENEDTGIYLDKRYDSWVAQGKSEGKTKHLGSFLQREDALKVATEWREENQVLGNGKSFVDERVTWRRVREVFHEAFTGDVFNLSIKGDESYIAEGIAVHNCAAVGHGDQVVTLNTSEGMKTPADQLILNLYEKACGYVPGDPNTDQGGVILDVLNYVRKHALGHKEGSYHKKFPLLAFAAINPSNLVHVKQSIYIFETVDIGINLPITAQSQVGRVWDVVGDPNNDPNSQPGSWGGHSVIVSAYTPTTVTCITWGQLQVMTWRFWNAYVDEAYALLYNARLDAISGQAPQAAQQLQEDLAAVTN
jgi:hypothetical protein